MRKTLNILMFLSLFALCGCYSCQSWHHAWGKAREDYPPDKFFWDKDCKSMAEAPAKPKPAAVSECGSPTVSRSYPCGSCGIIRLDKTMPSEVQLNAPFNYTIEVTNLSGTRVTDVVVTEHIPDSFKFTSAAPTAKKEDNNLSWAIGALHPDESKQIMVSGMATTAECLTHCATVTYVVPACANVKVIEPKLKLEKSAPSEVLLCDPIPIKFMVSNSGTGAARDVKIEDTLPSGLRTVDGHSALMFNAGTLDTGQSRQFSATLKASKTGKYVNKAVASSAGGLKAESETTTIVRQPVLAISKTSPEKRYLGRPVTYEITVSNKGDAPAENLVVEDHMPTGTKFVSASDGGRLRADKVVWNLGVLSAGSSRKVSLTISPQEAGDLTNTTMATATCAMGVSASARTTVEGIPAVLLEVIDIEDPVEVGSETTYVIVATNQGSSPGTNIRIVCTLEDNEQYVSSSGATRATVEANTVTFAPLRSLAPKTKATWRVVAKAMKAGDVRFKVTMNTDQIERPVEETEATHLYE
jgi:uncharacterized repeat protein (TIGR01451 family)